jgi:hypothetical protein
MFVLRRRLAVAGVIAAAAIAVPAAAFASGPGAPSGKPAPPQAAAASPGKSAAPSSLGGSQVKEGGLSEPPAPVQAFAAQLGVTAGAEVQRAYKQLVVLTMNNSADPASPAFTAIARAIGVSPAQLAAAWAAVEPSVPAG